LRRNKNFKKKRLNNKNNYEMKKKKTTEYLAIKALDQTGAATS